MAAEMNAADEASTTTIEIRSEDDARDAIEGGLPEGTRIEVEYIDTSGDERVETGTVQDTEFVPAGTERGSGSRTWTLSTGFWSVEYATDADTKDHTVRCDLDASSVPTLTVDAERENRTDTHTLGDVTSITIEVPAGDDDESDDDGVGRITGRVIDEGRSVEEVIAEYERDDDPLDGNVGCLDCGMSFPPEEMEGGCPGCEALADEDDEQEVVSDGGFDNITTVKRVRESDLSVGDVVDLERYNVEGAYPVVVTRLDDFAESRAPTLSAGHFGYIPLDWDASNIKEGHVHGTSHVRNIVKVARGGYIEQDADAVAAGDWSLLVSA